MEPVEHVLTALWIAGTSYLGWRALVGMCRIRWARFAYPDVQPAQRGSCDWQDRCCGCLVALGIGDALNLPAESLPRWLSRLRYPGGPKMRRGCVRFLRRPGDVSDDTQLTIAVARSVDLSGTYSHDRFIDELARWSYFRIGAGRASADAAIRARHQAPQASGKSKGNGAAIRVAPLAIAATDPQVLTKQVRENAQATHRTRAAVEGAAFVALLIHECLRRPKGFLDDPATLEAVVGELSAASGFRAAKLTGDSPPSGHVEQCIPAIVNTLLNHGSDFRAAMNSVFRAGGDTDSIGAIVGACIGAQIGYQALPQQWHASLQHRDYLIWLADRLSVPQQVDEYRGELVEVRGDVAQRDVDAIVNAWNRNLIPPWLLIPQGVSKAIRKAGGDAALKRIGKAGPIPLGGACETGPGTLAATWVIHAAAIDLAWRASEASIRSATRSSLQLAHWLGARTVALPILGAGSGGFSTVRSLEIIKREAEALRHNFDRIELVRFSAER